jgi:hypothetical protein
MCCSGLWRLDLSSNEWDDLPLHKVVRNLPNSNCNNTVVLLTTCTVCQFLCSDLWRLDLATYEWDQLPLKGGPSARSGHRMAVHKGRALLFGGFYDNGRDVK